MRHSIVLALSLALVACSQTRVESSQQHCFNCGSKSPTCVPTPSYCREILLNSPGARKAFQKSLDRNPTLGSESEIYWAVAGSVDLYCLLALEHPCEYYAWLEREETREKILENLLRIATKGSPIPQDFENLKNTIRDDMSKGLSAIDKRLAEVKSSIDKVQETLIGGRQVYLGSLQFDTCRSTCVIGMHLNGESESLDLDAHVDSKLWERSGNSYVWTPTEGNDCDLDLFNSFGLTLHEVYKSIAEDHEGVDSTSAAVIIRASVSELSKLKLEGICNEGYTVTGFGKERIIGSNKELLAQPWFSNQILSAARGIVVESSIRNLVKTDKIGGNFNRLILRVEGTKHRVHGEPRWDQRVGVYVEY